MSRQSLTPRFGGCTLYMCAAVLAACARRACPCRHCRRHLTSSRSRRLLDPPEGRGAIFVLRCTPYVRRSTANQELFLLKYVAVKAPDSPFCLRYALCSICRCAAQAARHQIVPTVQQAYLKLTANRIEGKCPSTCPSYPTFARTEPQTPTADVGSVDSPGESFQERRDDVGGHVG